MIELSGSVARNFVFPDGAAAAYQFYADVETTVPFLRYITLHKRHPEHSNQYRLAYRTTEMGVYEVTVYSDVEAIHDSEQRLFHLRPLAASPFSPVEMAFTSRYAVAAGDLEAKMVFSERPDGQTDVDYRYQMVSRFQLPAVMRFMPIEPIKQMIQQMVSGRLEEVADGFVRDSLAAYRNSPTKRQ